MELCFGSPECAEVLFVAESSAGGLFGDWVSPEDSACGFGGSIALGLGEWDSVQTIDWFGVPVVVGDGNVASGCFEVIKGGTGMISSSSAWSGRWAWSHGSGGTVWEVSLHGSNPLIIGEGTEVSPELGLSIGHTSFAVSWASADWSSGSESVSEELVVPAGFEEEDDDHDVKNTKTDKAETEHLSTSESSDETFVDGAAAGEGNSGVGVDGDSHTNVTGKDGGH